MPLNSIHLYFKSTLTLVLLVFSLSAFAAAPGKTLKLALNWKPEPQFGGFYAANLEGFDAKKGFTFDVMPGGAGTPVVQMVAAGNVPYGIASADEVVMSRSRGSDVVALFAVYQTNPQGIMVHPARGFKSIGDVYANGGKLAIQNGLPYALFLNQKYPAPKVKIVPYLGGIQNFLADSEMSQQCFVTSEPLTAKKQKAETKTFLIADEGYNPYTTVLITRASYLKDHAAEVKDVVAAVREGWRAYLDHSEKTDTAMSKLNPSMDVATMKESAEAQKSLIETSETKKSGLGTMTEARWKDLAHQLHGMKLITSEPEAKSIFQNL